MSDYTDSDKSSLKQNVANAAGVDKSLVAIRVTAASVIITATIAVPASMTADKMQSSLAARFDTADAASTALGITVVSRPSIVIIEAEKSPATIEENAETGGAVDSNLALPLTGAGALLLAALLVVVAAVLFRRAKR